MKDGGPGRRLATTNAIGLADGSCPAYCCKQVNALIHHELLTQNRIGPPKRPSLQKRHKTYAAETLHMQSPVNPPRLNSLPILIKLFVQFIGDKKCQTKL